MRSTRLRFLETTSFSVHIKTLSSKIVKHQIMPELGPREQSSWSKIIATISPRNQPVSLKHLFLCNETLVKTKPSISFFYYFKKQTVEYIETMNQEWDLNPGHLACVVGIRTRVTLFTDMVLSDTSSDLCSLRSFEW